MTKKTEDSLKAYETAGYRERYAMDNGHKNKYIDGRGHEMWRFTYSKHKDYQDANGATWDNTEGRWVG